MMIKQLITVLIFTIATSCGTTKTTTKSISENNYFEVQISQNGKIIKEKNGVIELKKEPFRFELKLKKTNDVFVSSSWGKYYYDYPKEKNIFECNDDSFFKGCRFVSVKTGSEDKFNTQKDIYVGDGDYQWVWFYNKKKEWHRFDKGVKVEKGIIYANVTVENIYDMDKRDEGTFKKSEYAYKIENINADIYMVFATNHYESGMEHPKELQRKNILLKFK